MDKIKQIYNEAIEIGRKDDNNIIEELNKLEIRAEMIPDHEILMKELLEENFPPIPIDYLLEYTAYIFNYYNDDERLINISPVDVKKALKDFCINGEIYNYDICLIYSCGWKKSAMKDTNPRSGIYVSIVERNYKDATEEDYKDTNYLENFLFWKIKEERDEEKKYLYLLYKNINSHIVDEFLKFFDKII